MQRKDDGDLCKKMTETDAKKKMAETDAMKRWRRLIQRKDGWYWYKVKINETDKMKR